MTKKKILLLFLLFCIFSLVAVHADSAERRLFLEAEGRFVAQEYGFAYQRYTEFVNTYPRSELVPDVQFRRAQCLYRVGQLSEALSLFERVSIRFSSTKYRLYIPFWIGIIHHDLGSYEKSIASLEEFLKNPDASLIAKANLYKGLSLYRLDRVPESIEVLTAGYRALNNPLEEPSLATFLASLLVKTGKYQDAIDLLQEVPVDSFPQEWKERLVLTLGEAYMGIGDPVQGEAAFRRLLTAKPDVAVGAFQRLFSIYQERGDDSELARILLSAEQALAGNLKILQDFWLRIGIESYSKGKYDLALGYFQRVWNSGSLKDIDPLVPLYMAEIAAREKDYKRALDTLNRYLTVSARGRELLLFRQGSLAVQAEDWAKSAETLSTFLKEFGSSAYLPEATYLYAFSLYKAGSFNESINITENAFTTGITGRFTDRFNRLASSLYRKTGDLDKALSAIKNYISLRPEDLSARIDSLKISYTMGRYQQLIEEVNQMDRAGLITSQHPYPYVMSRYLAGLSSVARREYEPAINFFKQITEPAIDSARLTSLNSYVQFYDGWSKYRLGRYEEGLKQFSQVSTSQTPLALRATYLAGWCAYSLKDHGKAEQFFLKYSATTSGYESDKGRLMYGKALAAQKKYDAAGLAFTTIYAESVKSPYAADALYEHAQTLALAGKHEDSAFLYKRLFDNHRESPLAEEALFKRAEILYSGKLYIKARDAFYDYRTAFERGAYVDASLYWGGMASFQAKEEFGAVLVWERLIERFKDSPFRPDALLRTAEFYRNTGDFRKALVFYTDLLAVYPEEAKAVSADLEAEKLRFILLGQSDREAELMVIRTREKGVETERGRKATIDLAKIYISKEGDSLEIALSLLQEVVGRSAEDPASAAQAQYLVGEYYFKKKDYLRAGNEFIKAATINPKDLDLMAVSIFKAAEMAKLSGNMTEARALIKRIEDNFPQSQWAEEGRRLLGGVQ